MLALLMEWSDWFCSSKRFLGVRFLSWWKRLVVAVRSSVGIASVVRGGWFSPFYLVDLRPGLGFAWRLVVFVWIIVFLSRKVVDGDDVLSLILFVLLLIWSIGVVIEAIVVRWLADQGDVMLDSYSLQELLGFWSSFVVVLCWYSSFVVLLYPCLDFRFVSWSLSSVIWVAGSVNGLIFVWFLSSWLMKVKFGSWGSVSLGLYDENYDNCGRIKLWLWQFLVGHGALSETLFAWFMVWSIAIVVEVGLVRRWQRVVDLDGLGVDGFYLQFLLDLWSLLGDFCWRVLIVWLWFWIAVRRLARRRSLSVLVAPASKTPGCGGFFGGLVVSSTGGIECRIGRLLFDVVLLLFVSKVVFPCFGATSVAFWESLWRWGAIFRDYLVIAMVVVIVVNMFVSFVLFVRFLSRSLLGRL